jgi:hypothetical protein
MSITGIWPFPSVFPQPTFSSRNLADKPASLTENIKFSLARLGALSVATIVLTELAIQISGRWRESDQERWLIPFTLYAVFSGICVAWHFFCQPRSFAKSVVGIIGVFLAFVILWAVSDVYGNRIMPRYVHPRMKMEIDMSFGRSSPPP